MAFYLSSYKRFSRLLQNETFEPMISWGIRMAISAMVPIIWGLATNNINRAIWITLTAEALCWIELKGSFAWRIRTLLTGAILAFAFAILGSVIGDMIWLSVLCMLLVGFMATLLKSVGDRASGLAICTYLLFIFSNGYPTDSFAAIKERSVLIAVGAVWTIFVGVLTSLFMPAEQPYRRQIALIWKAIGNLVVEVGKGWNGANQRSTLRDIYLKEKDIRLAIDSSYQFYNSMAHQVSEKDTQQFQLAQLRKSSSLVAVHVIAISEEMEALSIKTLDNALRIKFSSLFNAFYDTIERMSVFVLTLKSEEELILSSRLNRIKNLSQQIKAYPLPENEQQCKAIKRIIHLTERSIKLIESSISRLEQMGTDAPVFRSYSLIKTMFILHPKNWISNVRMLFNFNTFNTRYALRSAIAAALALFIYKWFNIDHGYWLPFSVMIIIQPYFGATLKKSVDRIAGTLLGGLAGGILLRLPVALHLKEVMLFATFILMVYYLRKKYAIAAFAITLNLVLLFNLESAYHPMLIVTRALNTIGGAALAIIAGFVLLPTWDKKWLPRHLADAIDANYQYFIATFFSPRKSINWTRNKRNVETRNSNVFDSFNRYMQEPSGRQKSTVYFDIITHNIRITRNLNNINAEQDAKAADTVVATPEQQNRINECLSWFNYSVQQAAQLNDDIKGVTTTYKEDYLSPFLLNDNQSVYLEKLLIELKTLHQDLELLLDKEHIE